MIGNHKIGIKIELSKDKNTKKLSIGVRFNSKASNVLVEKDSFTWFPTKEEIEFLNESFEMLSKEKKLEDEKTIDIPSKDAENIKIKIEDEEKVGEFKSKGSIKKGEEIIEEMIKRYIEKEKSSENEAHVIIDKVVNQKKRNKFRKI